MKQVIVFAGTTEGRLLSRALAVQGVQVLACTATEYGGQLVEKQDNLSVHTGRLDAEEIAELIHFQEAPLVVDATHPYAAVVSANIREACGKAGAEYLRLIRRSEEADGCIVTENTAAAAEYLKKTTGNVLLTTGSKELKSFVEIPDYQERLYARVLPSAEVMEACGSLRFTGKHLICMQGPFSKELNAAMLRQIGAAYMVTKESGKAGGFPEKLEAARETGVKVILIERPGEQPGRSPEEVCRYLEERFSLAESLCPEEEKTEKPVEKSDRKRLAVIAGIGMGTRDNMTREVWEACQTADCIIGAARMLEPVKELGKPMLAAYRPEEIRQWLLEHPSYEKAVLVQSGDVGFYSGARRLTGILKEAGFQVELLPGISSVVYLCSRLQTSWEDVCLMSIHGRKENLPAAVRKNKKVFTLLSGNGSVREMCEELIRFGLEHTEITVGEDLHYPGERLLTGTPRELLEQSFGGLCAALITNPSACSCVPACLDDDAFIRGNVPMTKAEVRSVSVAKLRLTEDAVVYDVGAGTGSVTIEMALQADRGMVYAVEKKEEAASLIEENMRRFGTPNVEVIRGSAPEALRELPVPTHAFIGGSSGNLKEILQLLLEKNPKIRIVMNGVTLETISEMNRCLKELPLTETEITQLQVAKARKLGGYQLMTGQNPVMIVSCTGADR